MNEGWVALLVAVFLLGGLAGALVWIPYTMREQQRRFDRQLELARRYRVKP